MIAEFFRKWGETNGVYVLVLRDKNHIPSEKSLAQYDFRLPEKGDF